MKNILLAFVSIFLIFSCSDKLTERKAKKIIEECMKNEDKKNIVIVKIGSDVQYVDTLKYKKLANEGYLLFSKNPDRPFQLYSSYTVKLTDKAKPFIKETRDNSALMITSTPVLEKVNHVMEVPAFGGAEVKIEIQNKDTTPFAILDEKNREFQIKNVMLQKTSKGWIYCDK